MKTLFKGTELTSDWIIKNAEAIHYFGLGFIQVKLNNFERLHFYTKELDSTVQPEEIHNHRYNFVSTVLKGHLKQDIYEFIYNAGNTHIMSKESCNTVKALFPETHCAVQKVYQKIYGKDDTYYIDHNTFHTVDSIDAITYVKRSDYVKQFAEVIRINGTELICPFSVNVEQNKLIEIIDAMLSN